MNPLKYRLPETQQTDTNVLQPRPSALAAWLAGQSTLDNKDNASVVFSILQAYNRCVMPAAVRLKAMLTLQPAIDEIVKKLRSSYQNEALPLRKGARAQANMAARFLDETACAYKRVVADSVLDTESNEMSINLFIAALRLTIDHLGKQLLECYVQFRPPPPGLWGEIHRTYQLAERNGLHTRVLAENENTANPFATVQHGYLRLALLGLATPNHLMPGQALQIYNYLETWTAGCRLLSKKVTVAEAGDIVVDLSGERPPAVSTGYARFRPVDGRFLDISALQEKLDEISASIDEQQQARHGVPLTIAERLRRDLLNRLRRAWQGRAGRSAERAPDMASRVQLSLGLEACHHFISEEEAFNPEQWEIRYHRPQETSNGLELAPLPNEDELSLNIPMDTTHTGLDKTRVSHFGETVDVWDAVHQTEIHVRSKREAAMAHFRQEPWLCINQSAGGLALRRLPEARSRTRVGTVTAFRHNDSEQWQVGALVWLHDEPTGDFDIGIQTLAHSAVPVAVRAIGGAGTGGEYFRSLLIQPLMLDDGDLALLTPANIYDIGTQLVLNRQTALEYVRLTRMIDTSSAFSLFAFKHIETPPAEQAKIDALAQANKP
ncbi:MAG TPA: hypothetical protein ENI97_07045 [Gammaproteobacteria bacterium]|nr:hypothetical protein [Gammaproteobacteria bacterium]